MPLLDASIRNRGLVAGLAALLVIATGIVASRMGGEFIPSLDEGDVAVQALRVPGTSLTQSVEMQMALEKRLLQIPEVKEVFARIGTAEVATDPMPPSISDGYVMLKPRDQWPDPTKLKATLVTEIEKASEEIAGSNYELSQPIQLRFNELISGVRSDVGVKIFGDDLETLIQVAAQVQNVLQAVPGAADVKTEQVAGLPVLTVKLNRPALARLGLSVADVQERRRDRRWREKYRPRLRGRPPLRPGRPASGASAIRYRRHQEYSDPAPAGGAPGDSGPRSLGKLTAGASAIHPPFLGRGDRDCTGAEPDQP